MTCYYNNHLCSGENWECETCHNHYCETHWHETDKGYCVECVACERERKENESEETENNQQVVVALSWEQADYLLNLLATQKPEIAAVIYDQIEQSQAECFN